MEQKPSLITVVEEAAKQERSLKKFNEQELKEYVDEFESLPKGEQVRLVILMLDKLSDDELDNKNIRYFIEHSKILRQILLELFG